MEKLERILGFLEDTFRVSEFPDYSHALNGLQVEGPDEVGMLAVAVDASEVTIQEGLNRGAQLLFVHHGLFWDGLGPITGPRFRKVGALIRGKMALYALHLPLDAHHEFGNCPQLCRALGWEPAGTFGAYKGENIGVWAETGALREGVRVELEGLVDSAVRLIPGGPEEVKRVGILTGGGAGSLSEANSLGLDTLITGEAAHHHFHEAMELGINLILAGHYATETFGVKAVGAHLARTFSLQWGFIDFPTGL